MNEQTSRTESASRERLWLRRIGVIVWVLGISSACILYWLRSRSEDWADDPALVGYSAPAERQMGVLYGKMGLLIDDLCDDLKRPGTQALILAGGSTIFAAGCFYFARWAGGTDGNGDPG